MDKYTYEAQDKIGKVRRGLLEADSIEAAEEILKYNQLSVIDVRPYLTWEEQIIHSFRSLLWGIRAKDKAVFARQLAIMINAGLPLMEALRTLVKQTPNRNMALVIFKIIALIERGKSFSSAVAQFPGIFSSIFVNMVRSGEASGKLDKVLTDLANQLESDYAMRSKIKGAVIYPVFIIFTMIGVGIFALVYIIPQLEGIFASAGARLPFTTTLLIKLSHFLSNFWYLALVLLIGFGVFLRYFISTNSGKTLAAYLALKTPPFKKINIGIYISNFSRTLGLLLGGGVPIIKSLAMVSKSVGNVLIERELLLAVSEVEKGIPLSTPLSASRYFPPLVASMIAVGEQTGQLDKILINLAEIYEEETNNLLKGLTSLLEPIIILVIGLGVAFLVISILLPIFQLSAVF